MDTFPSTARVENLWITPLACGYPDSTGVFHRSPQPLTEGFFGKVEIFLSNSCKHCTYEDLSDHGTVEIDPPVKMQNIL